jgi:DNA modification methylase
MQFEEIITKLKSKFKVYELPNGVIIQGSCFDVLQQIPKMAHCIINDYPWFDSTQTQAENQNIMENWKVPEPRMMAFRMKNVLAKGGIVWLFGMQPYQNEYHIAMEKQGFRFMQEIIWGKSERPSMGDGRYCLRAHANLFQYRFADVKLSDTHYDIKRVCINPEGDEEIRLNAKGAGSQLKGMIQPVASRLKWDGKTELVYRKNIGYPRSIQEFGVVKEYSAEYVGHPSQVPIALDMELIEMSTLPGDIVIDPFSGSGTTASACEALGRKYIVMEITAEWAEKGYQRVLRDIHLRSDEYKAENPTLTNFDMGESDLGKNIAKTYNEEAEAEVVTEDTNVGDLFDFE